MSTDDTRTRMLHAAGPIFADKGFTAATVREICQQAEVNLASVNYYFGDKERLYIETVKMAHRNRTEQAPMPAWDEDTTPEQKLRDFIGNLLTRMLGVPTSPWQTRLMMREVLSPTSACKELVEEYFRPHFELLLSIVGQLLPENEPRHVCEQIGFSIVGQCLYYRVAGDVVALLVESPQRQQHYTIDKLADHISNLTLAALANDTYWANSRSKVPALPRGAESIS